MAEHDKDEQLDDLAGSILDGRPIDWQQTESHANARDRDVMRQLRLVSAVAEVHRSLGLRLSQTRTDGSTAELLRPPARWGPLDVLEHVGRGSFGDVYRAWDRQLDREVALKLLYEPDEVSEAALTVLAEGRLLARVRHPNVVTIHGADRLDGRIGLWMEYVHGRTLEQLLGERGTFGSQEAVLVGVDLCRALSAVHSAGVVHRDIKAQNVMREEGGRIVLMDFGTGREPSRDAGEPTLTGTPLYLAPELYHGKLATRQSDIYSLGILLFHLVSGSYPVQGRSVDEIRAGHRQGRRAWLRDFRPDLPERFIQTIEPALAADPGARYQSAGEMEQALLAALPGLDGQVGGRRDVRPNYAITSTQEHVPRRSRAMWMAGAGVTTAVVLGGLTFGQRVLHLLPGTGSPPSNVSPAAALVGETDLVARRMSLPQTTFVGRPSPDGRFLPYVDLNGDLCLLEMATGQSRALTNKGQSEEGAESQIAISPDGTRIAYAWLTLDGTHEIRLVGLDGLWPRVLLRRSDVAYSNPLQWSADGTGVLAMLELVGGSHQLVLISAATGAVKPLRTFAGGQYHPALSPDGRFVAFDRAQQDNPRARDVFVLDVETGSDQTRTLIEHPANDLFPIWTRDGRLLFVSDRTGTLGLWSTQMVDGRATSDPVILVRDIGRLAMPLGLTDEGALYYYVQNGMVDVYSQSIDLAGQTPPGTGKPVSSSFVGANSSSEWSRDGRYLAYVAMRGWVQNDRYSRSLVIRDMETGEERDLQPALTFFIEPRWSPDGRTILVRGSDLRKREGIFAVDVGSGRSQAAVTFAATQVQSAVFQWSPDGGAVWYDKARTGAIVAHDLATGREEVVVEYARESIQRLEQWPGFRISPDGRSIAYTGFTFENNTGGTVIKVRVLGGPSQEVARATSPERVEFQDWTPDGEGVLLVRRNTKERRQMLYEARLDGTPPRPLGVTMDAMRDVSLRRDGKALTYTAGANTLEVWVLKNFLTSTAAGLRMER